MEEQTQEGEKKLQRTLIGILSFSFLFFITLSSFFFAFLFFRRYISRSFFSLSLSLRLTIGQISHKKKAPEKERKCLAYTTAMNISEEKM